MKHLQYSSLTHWIKYKAVEYYKLNSQKNKKLPKIKNNNSLEKLLFK